MKCEHIHKDLPENAVCADCQPNIKLYFDEYGSLYCIENMKGGKNDRKDN